MELVAVTWPEAELFSGIFVKAGGIMA